MQVGDLCLSKVWRQHFISNVVEIVKVRICCSHFTDPNVWRFSEPSLNSTWFCVIVSVLLKVYWECESQDSGFQVSLMKMKAKRKLQENTNRLFSLWTWYWGVLILQPVISHLLHLWLLQFVAFVQHLIYSEYWFQPPHSQECSIKMWGRTSGWDKLSGRCEAGGEVWRTAILKALATVTPYTVGLNGAMQARQALVCDHRLLGLVVSTV